MDRAPMCFAQTADSAARCALPVSWPSLGNRADEVRHENYKSSTIIAKANRNIAPRRERID
jgi:hypothetical protein